MPVGTHEKLHSGKELWSQHGRAECSAPGGRDREEALWVSRGEGVASYCVSESPKRDGQSSIHLM